MNPGDVNADGVNPDGVNPDGVSLSGMNPDVAELGRVDRVIGLERGEAAGQAATVAAVRNGPPRHWAR